MYYWISTNEDGEWSIGEFENINELQEEINNNIDGVDEEYKKEYLESFHIPMSLCDDYHKFNVIIEGKRVFPRPVKVVEQIEIKE